ncbi:MAG: PIN domain-containing protein [Gemmataceae bacterium]|nr:PIN domain-containing protein [Gemmataceae bacterium]
MIYFCDTFALVAWVNVRDVAHQAVVDFFTRTPARYLLTEWIIVETLDALSRPRFRQVAAGLTMQLRRDPQFEIIPYDPRIFQAGFDLYLKRPDKDWSLTDCISFAVMNQRGLTHALTADVHFVQAGFQAVFATP